MINWQTRAKELHSIFSNATHPEYSGCVNKGEQVMTTEQYQIGYEEGYQEGWNAAVEENKISAARADELAELLRLLTDKTPFPSYFCNHKERYECCDCGKEHEDYTEIVHTENCDSVKALSDRKRIAELVGVLKSTPTPQQSSKPHQAQC